MKRLRILTMLATALLTSCGTIYNLKGHNSGNANNPPDVTMQKGEKKRALTSGFERFGIAIPPYGLMRVEDSSIVGIVGVDWVAYLVAKNTGTTRVRYSPETDGFLVHVVDSPSTDEEQVAP